MNLGPFVPLIILIFLAVLVFLGIRWFSKSTVARRGYWMLGVYGVILLISVGIYYFIPVSAEDTERESSWDSAHYEHYEIFNGVISGEEDIATIEEFKMKEWEFSFDDDTLRIESRGIMQHNVRIAAERTENDVIEAAFYRTPLVFEGREIETGFIPVHAQLESDRLDLTFQESTEEFRFASFTKEFPMQQFDDHINNSFGSSFGFVQWSDQLLFLQIPEDIEISTDSEVHIEYLN